MTLTLDDVRNMKFRIARRSGYEVLDVDQFVDRVEEAFAQLTEENQQLKQEVAELRRAAEAAAADRPAEPAAPAEPAPAPVAWTPPAPAPQPAPAVSQGDQIVVRTADDASPAVVRLVQLATEQSERLVDEAREESDQILTQARQEATSITGAARTQAERLESEARLTADRLRNEAQNRATAFEEELRNRRRDTFQAMESERDQLRESVAKLRSFEQTFRSNLTDHLQAQIKTLAGSRFEPSETPALLTPAPDEDQRGSRRGESGAPAQTGQGNEHRTETPRLDALLGGQN